MTIVNAKYRFADLTGPFSSFTTSAFLTSF
jgi:hypothetical protein